MFSLNMLSIPATRVAGAAIEVAVFTLSKNKFPTTTRADAVGHRYFFVVNGAVRIHCVLRHSILVGIGAARSESFDDAQPQVIVNYRFLVVRDGFVEVCAIHDIVVADPQPRYVCFVVEYHDRNHREIGETAEYPAEETNMSLVLANGIVELIFFAVDVLRPVFRILIAEYPPFVAFRFNNEKAEGRNHNVVYLRGASARSAKEQHIVHDVIFVRQSQQFIVHPFFRKFPLVRSQVAIESEQGKEEYYEWDK